MAVETIIGSVVTVASVGGVALDTLTTVSTRYGSVETLPGAVSSYALLFVYFALQI